MQKQRTRTSQKSKRQQLLTPTISSAKTLLGRVPSDDKFYAGLALNVRRASNRDKQAPTIEAAHSAIVARLGDLKVSI